MAGNDKYIKSFIPNGISVADNFSDSSSYFTTRDDDNPNAIHIFSYYKEMSISIRPLSMLEGKDDFVFTELDYYYDEVPNALSLVQEAYSGYNFTHMEIGSFQFDKDTAIKDLFIYYSVIVFILSLLYIFFKISYSSKEIMIYKLQGYSNFRIIGSIFKSEIVLNILSVILIPIIGTLIVFRGSNFRMIELLVYSFAYLGLMLIVIMLCIIMGLVFVSNQRMSDLLKNKNYNRALTTIIFLLAIVVSVTILPKIEEPFRNLVQMLNMKNKVDKHADMARKYNELGINLVKDRSFEVDHFALMGGIEDPVYEKHKKIYNYLNENKIIVKQNKKEYVDKNLLEKMNNADTQIPGYRGYEINENYLELATFYSGGSKIALGQLEDNTLYIFMPRSIYEISEFVQREFTNDNDLQSKIILYDQVDYPELSIEYDRVSGFDPIFVLIKNGNDALKDVIGSGMFISSEHESEAIKYFEEEGVLESISIANGNEIVESLYKGMAANAKILISSMIPAIAVLIMTLVTMKHFYMLSVMKEWSIYKALGYNAWYVARKYLFEVIAIFIITFCYYLLIAKNIPKYTLAALFVVLAINVLAIVYNYRKLDISKELR